MAHYFVTSTGTEIGKTLITAGLAYQMGFKAFKPIISGVSDVTMAGSDTDILAAAQGLSSTKETWDQLSPLRFQAPLAPSMAAELEGRKLDYDHLIALCAGWLQAHPHCLIEGVGGAFVPVVGKKLVADWIADLGIPSLLVTGSYLGTLSHTLATVEAMHHRGLRIDRIILSESAGEGHPDLHRTHQELERLTDLPVTLVPRTPGSTPWQNLPPLF